MNALPIATTLLLSSLLLPAAEDLTVLTNEPGRQLEYRLKREFDQHVERRLKEFEALKTPADLEKWQRERREFFVKQIGGFPERTALNAKVVGKLQGQGYRVENVLFESRPGHHVTGNLYLPETKGPYPGVLIPCGHSHNGKAAGGYQRMGILLARNGMAALCYDPIGQGERYQALDFERTHERFASVSYHLPVPHPRVQFLCTVEHTMMGVGAILLGSNVGQYRIWDGMRAIDYLQSREDIIADKIGCTGNSGGGTMTAYLGALDDRIYASMPICYLTTFKRLIESKGAQDGEQNIFGQIAFGMDEADYVIMRAPRPTQIGAATRDATFDINGTWEIFREAKRFYSMIGYPERVDLHEGNLRHGMYLPQREASARWMHRWLLGEYKVIHEVDPQLLPPQDPRGDKEWLALSKGDWTQEQLYCTPEGQVLLMPDERSVFQINAERERNLRKSRQAAWSKLNDNARRRLIRNTVGATTISTAPASEIVGRINREGYSISKIKLNGSANDLTLPGLLFTPDRPTGKPYLYLHGESMKADAAVGGPVEKLVQQGHIVLAAELSGIGETETGHHKRDYGRGRFGRDVQEIYLAYLIGKSFVGLRTQDVIRWSRFMEQFLGLKSTNPIRLIAAGEAAIPALHASALEPKRFGTIRIDRMIKSWAALVAAPVNQDQLVNTVHGALRHYDLPDLVRLAGTDRVTIEEPVDATGAPLE